MSGFYIAYRYFNSSKLTRRGDVYSIEWGELGNPMKVYLLTRTVYRYIVLTLGEHVERIEALNSVTYKYDATEETIKEIESYLIDNNIIGGKDK